jgi:hypothetical protein
MTRQSISSALALAMLVLAACSSDEERLARNPTSVRGWILDVKGSQHEQAPEMEIARRTQLFAATTVWVENVELASGGVAENGAFIVLDVPPNQSTLGFNAPGAETARVVLEGVPGSADVFIPDVILEPNGAKVLDPKKILVRVPADVDKPTPTGAMATVAGYKVPIISTPLKMLVDRREYPNPGGFRPVATFK